MVGSACWLADRGKNFPSSWRSLSWWGCCRELNEGVWDILRWGEGCGKAQIEAPVADWVIYIPDASFGPRDDYLYASWSIFENAGTEYDSQNTGYHRRSSRRGCGDSQGEHQRRSCNSGSHRSG